MALGGFALSAFLDGPALDEVGAGFDDDDDDAVEAWVDGPEGLGACTLLAMAKGQACAVNV